MGKVTEPKTTKVEFYGGFHNCRGITLRVRLVYFNGTVCAKLSERQEKKLSDHFCGIPGCCCGGYSRASINSDFDIEESWE